MYRIYKLAIEGDQSLLLHGVIDGVGAKG